MNTSKRFKEDKLPEKDCFFNSLKDCCISDEEHQRAIDIWKVFNIKHDLYLKTDVLLLCDILKSFCLFKKLWIRSLSLF